MTGAYNIQLEQDGKLIYDFTIERNFTSVVGDSGIGKTYFIESLVKATTQEFGDTVTKFKLHCDVACVGIPSGTQYVLLASIIRTSSKTIFFIDEGLKGILETKFSKLIRGSDNYFVIVGRDKIGTISYSYKSVMMFNRMPDGVLTLEPYLRVDDDSYLRSLVEKETIILPEDEKVGYELIAHSLGDYNVEVGGGRDYYSHYIKQNKPRSIMLIIDGAAFGAKLTTFLKYISENKGQCVVGALLVESFEYTVLESLSNYNSQLLEVDYLTDNIDSVNFMSWEEYFTEELTTFLKSERRFDYDKSSILAVLTTEEVLTFSDNLKRRLKLDTSVMQIF